jgi:hypothetical protein
VWENEYGSVGNRCERVLKYGRMSVGVSEIDLGE